MDENTRYRSSGVVVIAATIYTSSGAANDNIDFITSAVKVGANTRTSPASAARWSNATRSSVPQRGRLDGA